MEDLQTLLPTSVRGCDDEALCVPYLGREMNTNDVPASVRDPPASRLLTLEDTPEVRLDLSTKFRSPFSVATP